MTPHPTPPHPTLSLRVEIGYLIEAGAFLGYTRDEKFSMGSNGIFFREIDCSHE